MHKRTAESGAAFRKFVEARPADCSVEFHQHGGSPAINTTTRRSSPRPGRAVDNGPKPAVMIMGGSIPIVGDFQTYLGMESLLVGFLSDDRIHSPNEKYELSSPLQGSARSWAHSRR